MQDERVKRVLEAIAEKSEAVISAIYECEDIYIAFRYNERNIVGLGPIRVEKKDYSVSFFTSGGGHIKYMNGSKLIWERKS